MWGESSQLTSGFNFEESSELESGRERGVQETSKQSWRGRGEPGLPKVRAPGEKSVEVVTSQALEASRSVPRKTHAFGMRAQCLW